MKITIHKYSDHFAKVHALQYSVRVQSEVIKRKRQTLHQVPNTFVSKPCRRILISCLVCILRPVKLRGSKKISLLFLHLFITLERTGKTNTADAVFELHYTGTFSPNLS